MEMEVSYDQKRTHIGPLLHRTALTLWLNFFIFGEAHRGVQHINESALKSQMAIFKNVQIWEVEGVFRPSNIKYRPNNPPRQDITHCILKTPT